MAPKYKAFLVSLLVSLGADQGTKLWARHALAPRGTITVVPGFWEFRYAENTGSAFSLLRGGPLLPYLFAAIALVALVVIGIYLKKAQPRERLFAVGMGLLGGGALGNLIDRIAFQKVTDFVVWRYHDHVWPTFNVADAVLVVGVLGLMLLPRRQAT